MQNLHSYERYIVAFSGGKDSISCVLHLLEMGVPKERIELWHNNVDGNSETFMDWECTSDYCRKFAAHFGLAYYESWLDGGFKREMLRDNQRKAATYFETPDGVVSVGGKKGKLSTRRKFPQVSANLSCRWCSAYLKIDVYKIALRNQNRFNQSRTLVISGERAEESANRANYADFEVDETDNRNGRTGRLVDRWRPVLRWSEKRVWDIIERWRVVVHPCYYLGFSRCSCKFCIFGNADQFASAAAISPAIVAQVIEYEQNFGVTIKRNKSVKQLIADGTPYKAIDAQISALATSKTYSGQIVSNNWFLPSGAFGVGCGAS